jgi:DNA invertase Pin-like site-specific DNA recombinase
VDDEKSESMSISHQRLILDKHIDALDVPNMTVLEFVDNGYSGTDMERPAVQELLELLRSGGVNMIIVKDFSRFSRNAMDSGYFVEQVFPLFGVRFVAISDDFDSDDYKNDTGGIDVAFKFLMHEYYCKDLSLKVSSARRVKMLRGESIPKNAIYGYYKSEQGRWEPDEPAASVIRQIYQMALQGLPATKIKDELFKAGHPTPSEFINMKRGKEVVPTCLWHTQGINRILQNEQYAGTYISGKLKSLDVGSKVRVPVDKGEWIVMPNHHTPIVSKEIFDSVQAILETHLKGKVVAAKPNVSWQDNVTTKKRRDMISGAFKIRKVKYGYRKMADGSLGIDEVAANVIREVFELARSGLSFDEIRDKLTAEKHIIPNDHLELQRGVDITPSCQWKTVAVRGILANEQYAGTYVSGKTVKDYETGKIVCVPKCDWIVIPDMRPAIISKELFDEVQEIIAERKYNPKYAKSRNHLLKGKFFCGHCGYAMLYDPAAVPLYHCYNTASDTNALCCKMKYTAKEIDEAVLAVIRKTAEVVLNASEFNGLSLKGDSGKEQTDLKKRIAEINERRQKHYESYILREIDRAEFLELKDECSAEIERLEKQVTALRTESQAKTAFQSMRAIAKRAVGESISHKELVETLVEKVCVFSDNRIEIVWKISDFTKVG